MSSNPFRTFANLPSLDKVDTENDSELPVRGYLVGPINATLSPSSSDRHDHGNDPKLSSDHGDTARGSPPSVDDMIEWNLGQSYLIGDLGFTCNFPTADTVLRNPDHGLDDGKGDGRDLLEAAINGMEDEYEQVLQRMDIMNSHPAVRIETEHEVDRRLLATKKTQSEIDNHTKEGTTLGHKIEDLYRLEKEQTATTSNVAPAFLLYGPIINPKTVEINLHIDGSLSEFRLMVKDHLKCRADPWTPFESIYHEDRPWKYFFHSKMQSEKSRPLNLLEEESQYEKLIRQIKAPTTISLDAVLTQVSA